MIEDRDCEVSVIVMVCSKHNKACYPKATVIYIFYVIQLHMWTSFGRQVPLFLRSLIHLRSADGQVGNLPTFTGLSYGEMKSSRQADSAPFHMAETGS